MQDHYVPNVTFKTRVRDESIDSDKPIRLRNPYRWQDVTTDDLFAGKKVILFSLPGAFTPTCSTYQLPDFEKMHDEFYAQGIDALYCMGVNDTFVMNAWAKSLELEHVKVIPDGNGEFTRQMGMLVNMSGAGFGYRSWRYAVVVEDKKITYWFVEPGKQDNLPDDPYGVSSPENIFRAIAAVSGM